MIEYIYDAIKSTAGADITINAKITDVDGAVITDGCALMLYDNDSMITSVSGSYADDEWSFTIPANVTDGLCGRYWYCIYAHDNPICFKQPIYLV